MWANVGGTARGRIGAGIHCGGASRCRYFVSEDVNITAGNGEPLEPLSVNLADYASIGLWWVQRLSAEEQCKNK